MTPLHTFLNIARELAEQPIRFWDINTQHNLISDTKDAINKLIDILEKKELKDTIAYKTLTSLKANLTCKPVKELDFTRNLLILTEIYLQTPSGAEQRELLSTVLVEITKAKQRALEHHIALETLQQKGKKMTADQKLQNDKNTIQKIGIFYILEYTLQVLFEFTRLSETDKIKLLNDGLATPAGNLPAYRPLEDTFRKELCYNIFDESLRDQLLLAFYNLEKVLYNNNTQLIGSAIKTFNSSLLESFKSTGLTNFQALIYTPFGSKSPIDQIIKKVEDINFN